MYMSPTLAYISVCKSFRVKRACVLQLVWASPSRDTDSNLHQEIQTSIPIKRYRLQSPSRDTDFNLHQEIQTSITYYIRHSFLLTAPNIHSIVDPIFSKYLFKIRSGQQQRRP